VSVVAVVGTSDAEGFLARDSKDVGRIMLVQGISVESLARWKEEIRVLVSCLVMEVVESLRPFRVCSVVMRGVVVSLIVSWGMP
jgi:hypothetical protein